MNRKEKNEMSALRARVEKLEADLWVARQMNINALMKSDAPVAAELREVIQAFKDYVREVSKEPWDIPLAPTVTINRLLRRLLGASA